MQLSDDNSGTGSARLRARSRRLPVSLIAGAALGLVGTGIVLLFAVLDESAFGGLLVAAVVAATAGAAAVALRSKFVRPLIQRDGTRLGLKTGAIGSVLTIPSLFAATFLNGNSLTFLPGGFNLRPFFYGRYGMETGHLLIVIGASFLTVIGFMAFARIGGMIADVFLRPREDKGRDAG
jgi:hypothetical protein